MVFVVTLIAPDEPLAVHSTSDVGYYIDAHRRNSSSRIGRSITLYKIILSSAKIPAFGHITARSDHLPWNRVQASRRGTGVKRLEGNDPCFKPITELFSSAGAEWVSWTLAAVYPRPSPDDGDAKRAAAAAEEADHLEDESAPGAYMKAHSKQEMQLARASQMASAYRRLPKLPVAKNHLVHRRIQHHTSSVTKSDNVSSSLIWVTRIVEAASFYVYKASPYVFFLLFLELYSFVNLSRLISWILFVYRFPLSDTLSQLFSPIRYVCHALLSIMLSPLSLILYFYHIPDSSIALVMAIFYVLLVLFFGPDLVRAY